METTCPCGSGRPFDTCCEPYLEGRAAPPTAEALMRSRFVAYSRRQIDYLATTSGGEAAASFSRKDAAAWANAATFTRLEVFATERGAETDDEGIVDFAATYTEGGKVHVLRERSIFQRQGGLWRYTGHAKGQPATREGPRVGRNDPCPCGSGQKYKKCHGA